MTDANAKVHINENALVQKVGDEMVILDSQSGQYYALNEMATHMLEHLKDGESIASTATLICDEYEADESEVTADIITMVNTLLEKQLASLAP
jgi:hypothetical protein